jgi:hypothetical protein
MTVTETRAELVPHYAESWPGGKVHRVTRLRGPELALCGFRPRHGWFDVWPGVRYIPGWRTCRRCAERAT